jgi:hypothetical protein
METLERIGASLFLFPGLTAGVHGAALGAGTTLLEDFDDRVADKKEGFMWETPVRLRLRRTRDWGAFRDGPSVPHRGGTSPCEQMAQFFPVPTFLAPYSCSLSCVKLRRKATGRCGALIQSPSTCLGGVGGCLL